MKKFYFLILAALVMAACETSPSGGGGGGGGGSASSIDGIPSDDSAVENPDISDADTIITLPGVQTTVTTEGDDIVIRLDMTGIIDPVTGQWLKLIGSGAGQNVYVEVDGTPKGIEVINLSEGSGVTAKADLVFLIDNSGSMGDEADAVADGISDWSRLLAASGLDIRFGVVGYGYNVGSQYTSMTSGYGIAGGMDLANYDVLNSFLNERDRYGVQRTVDFFGEKAVLFDSLVYYGDEGWYNAGGECGMQAVKFAEKYFSFRRDASRVYVNFTDDANYPGGDERWSLASIRGDKWDATRGTIHTVFSNDTLTSWVPGNLIDGYEDLIKERSWEMSWITGGSITWTDPYFTDVTLNSLEVTGAMQNSYIIRFTNVAGLMDGKPHLIHITIKTTDGSVAGELYFYVTFGGTAA